MAEDKVIVPIELSVTDIRTGDIDLKDVQKSIQDRLSGIAKSAGDVLGNIDTSKLNKALTTSMDKVTNSYQKLAISQSKMNEAIRNAGSSSPIFKKELKSIQAEIDKTERNWEEFAEHLLENPLLKKGLDKRDMGLDLTSYEADAVKFFEAAASKYEATMAELNSRMPTPEKFVDTATTTELQKLVTTYYSLFNAITKVETATKDWQATAANNALSDEYIQKTNELVKYENQLERIKAKAQKMAEVGASDKSWKNLQYDANLLDDRIQTIIEDLRIMVEEGSAFRFGTGDATAELDALTERLNNVKDVMSELPNAPDQAKTRIKSLLSTIDKFVDSAAKGFSNVIKNLKDMGKTGNDTTKKLRKSFKKLWRDILMFGFGVRSTFFLVRRLRNVFIESFKEMSKQVPEVNDSISAFVKALNQIKGSVATVFQPLASVVIPWFVQFTAVLNDAMNALARFFATLTGQGYIYKFTAAQVDYAESLDKTAGSAKKAQKSLMGFDEINRLNDNTDSGAGSGDIPTGTWEKEMLDGMSSLAELIKQAWAEKDFTEVGKYLGEQLLGALQLANIWINTKGFALASDIGNSFATLINGALAIDALGPQLGITLANALNMALIGIHKFLTTTNWIDLGQFIADWANFSVTTFDWSLLGKTVGALITAAVNTWWKFMGELDFSELAYGITTAINSLFSSVLVIDETGLTSAQKLGQSITNVVHGILTTFISVITNTNWSEVGKTIGQVFANIDWSTITMDFTKLVSAIITALAEAFSGWVSTDTLSASIGFILATAFVGVKVAPIISGFLKLFSKIFASKSKVSIIANGEKVGTVFSGIGDKLKPALDAILGFGTKISDVFWLIFKGGETVKGAMELVFGTTATFITGFITTWVGAAMAIGNFFEMLANGFSWAKEILMLLGIAIASVGALILGAPAFVVGIVAGIVAAVATLVVLVKEHWNEICTFVANLWKNMTTTVVNIWNGFITGLKNGLAALSNWWTNTWSAIKNYVATTWNNIKTTVLNSLTALRTGISTAITNIKSAWTNGWTAMKTSVVNIWNGIWGFIKNIINSIIGGINGMISGVVSGVNAIVGVLNKLKIDIPKWVPEFGGQSFGFSLPTVSAPQIPKLAQGGVIPPNQEFMAILGDQKHGTNIEAPLDTIKQAVAEELAEYIDAMMVGFEAVVQAINDKDLDVRIGDSAIGKAAERYSKRQALVRGTT